MSPFCYFTFAINPAFSTAFLISSGSSTEVSTVRVRSGSSRSTDQDWMPDCSFSLGVTLARQLPQLMLVLNLAFSLVRFLDDSGGVLFSQFVSVDSVLFYLTDFEADPGGREELRLTLVAAQLGVCGYAEKTTFTHSRFNTRITLLRSDFQPGFSKIKKPRDWLVAFDKIN